MTEAIDVKDVPKYFDRVNFNYGTVKAGKEVEFEFKHTLDIPHLGYNKSCTCITNVDISKQGVVKGKIKPEPNQHDFQQAGLSPGAHIVQVNRNISLEFDTGEPLFTIAPDGLITSNRKRTRVTLTLVGDVDTR